MTTDFDDSEGLYSTPETSPFYRRKQPQSTLGFPLTDHDRMCIRIAGAEARIFMLRYGRGRKPQSTTDNDTNRTN